MDMRNFKAYLEEEAAAPFEGWNFSRLDGRWQGEDLAWDYGALLKERLRPSDRLLDMGTGGGEFLLTLGHPYGCTAVTEDYPPNLALCRARLEPLGVTVRETLKDGVLPFEDASFDMVANRHEDFTASEVFRVLKPGGVFITQQVGGRNNQMLSKKLIDSFFPQFPEHDLKHNRTLLEAAGFQILRAEEALLPLRFFDIGAVAYFAKIIEWEFPGFSVEGCFDRLCALRSELEEKGSVLSEEHRFLLLAQK